MWDVGSELTKWSRPESSTTFHVSRKLPEHVSVLPGNELLVADLLKSTGVFCLLEAIRYFSFHPNCYGNSGYVIAWDLPH